MAFLGSGSNGHAQGSFSTTHAHSAGDRYWDEQEQPSRDWKKIVLVIGLGTLSWVATYIGMLELIQANMGDLPLVHKVVIGFSVAMLMIMIIWLLDQIFSPAHTSAKFLYVIGYIFLTLISVGFGFGFYWKVLESRSESTRSAESAIGQVQNSLHAGATRMEQLNKTLVQLTEISTAKAIEEREKGTSCPNSRPGDGPRRKLRDDDAQQFKFASNFVGSRVTTVKADMTALDADLAKVVSRDKSTVDAATGTRNDFLRGLSRRLDITVTGFNAFRTDPQLRQIRADLSDRAGKTIFPNTKGGTFACPDPQLQAALRGVVRAIDQLPDLQKPQIAAVEGSEATIEAFRRLTASITGVLTLTPPLSPDDLRRLQKKAVQSVSGSGSATPAAYAQPTGLSKRDYVPLSIAIFVDLCLLLVSIGQPMNRLGNLVPKMREAEKGPVIRILSKFNEIHRDPEIRQNFEVFRHVVFDYLGDYYVAVPLDTPYNRVSSNGVSGSYGAAEAQELQHEAHLLANLFASFEQEKIFKRVFFMPTRTVRARLERQGSKFAGSSAFRLYRFKEGAWSDIILGAVMGAAKRVEEEKEQQRAREKREEAANERALPDEGSRSSVRAASEPTPRKGAGESGPSGKVPPLILRHDVGDDSQKSAMPIMNGANGHANGHDSNGKHTAPLGGIDFNLGDDDPDLNFGSEDEATIRSRYGKYASKILAERTDAATKKAVKSQLTTRDAASTDQGANASDSVLPTPAANSNTHPVSNSNTSSDAHTAAEVVIGEAPRDNAIESAIESSPPQDAKNVVPLPGAQPIVNGSIAEATVTLTRETATYTVPASEATLPPSLNQAVRAHSAIAERAIADDAQDVIDVVPATSAMIPPPLPQNLMAVESPPSSVEGDDDITVSIARRLKPQSQS